MSLSIPLLLTPLLYTSFVLLPGLVAFLIFRELLYGVRSRGRRVLYAASISLANFGFWFLASPGELWDLSYGGSEPIILFLRGLWLGFALFLFPWIFASLWSGLDLFLDSRSGRSR